MTESAGICDTYKGGTMMTAKVGQKAPDFHMPTTKNLETLDHVVKLADYQGKWLVLFFYPLDFTFVWPTEIRGFSARLGEFRQLNAEILAVSTDSVFSHRAWIQAPTDKGGLGQIDYPLASDITREASAAYGVLLEDKGIAQRGLFIIDPEGEIQSMMVNNLDVGRSIDETLRLLQAIQSRGLCPIDWKPGDKHLG